MSRLVIYHSPIREKYSNTVYIMWKRYSDALVWCCCKRFKNTLQNIIHHGREPFNHSNILVGICILNVELKAQQPGLVTILGEVRSTEKNGCQKKLFFATPLRPLG